MRKSVQGIGVPQRSKDGTGYPRPAGLINKLWLDSFKHHVIYPVNIANFHLIVIMYYSLIYMSAGLIYDKRFK